MKTGLVVCGAAAIAVAVTTFAPTKADAGCWGCAVGAGVFGGLVAGTIIGSAAASAAAVPPPPPPAYVALPVRAATTPTSPCGIPISALIVGVHGCLSAPRFSHDTDSRG